MTEQNNPKEEQMLALIQQASDRLLSATVVLATRGQQESDASHARIDQLMRESVLNVQSAIRDQTTALKEAQIERDRLLIQAIVPIIATAVQTRNPAPAQAETPVAATTEAAKPSAPAGRRGGRPPFARYFIWAGVAAVLVLISAIAWRHSIVAIVDRISAYLYHG